jgi:hypothetical protein
MTHHHEDVELSETPARRVAAGFGSRCVMISGMTGGKNGRPHKGDRHVSTLRLPRGLYERVKADATEAGVPVVDFLNHVVSTYYGTPEHDPLAGRQQHQLDMTA